MAGAAAQFLFVFVPPLKAVLLPLPQLGGNLDRLLDVQRGKPLRPIARRLLGKQYAVRAIEVFAGDRSVRGSVFGEEGGRSFGTRRDAVLG